jgi:anti-sigma factor RsiW
MGGRIVDLLSSPHRAAEALMPWLINGSLSPAEQHELARHLNDCAACRAELERQRRLTHRYRETAAAEPLADGSAAFARLAARLDAEALPAARRARPVRGWRLVAALQFCVIAALAWTVWLLRPDAPAPDAAPVYRGLAASPSASGDAIVFFAGGATAAEVGRVLRQSGARIVDGPTAAGAYVLRFEHSATDAAVAALRAERAVIRVEPLVAVGGPPSAPPVPHD